MPQSFTRGLLTGIDGFAPSIRYHPNGTVHQVRHANGVDWLQWADPNDMQRPSRIHTSGASDELDTGLYDYDGAGNVTRTGADRYAYDRHSRISEARLGAFPEACSGDLVLSSRTETSPVTHEACGRIDAGPAYTVESDVRLRAEDAVVLHDGVTVAEGGSLVVESGTPVNDAPESLVQRTQSYLFDRFGNLTERTTDEGTLDEERQTLQYDTGRNRLSSGLATYDSSGNITSQPVGMMTSWGYDYDPFNMPRHVTTPEGNGYVFVYGPGEERTLAVDWSDGSDFSLWHETYTLRGLDGSPLRQYRVDGGNAQGNWSLYRDYVWRDGTLLASIRNSTSNFFPEAVYFLHPDHLGSPRLITNEDGGTVRQIVYFPFGQEATTPSETELLKYTGHERDFFQDGQGGTPEDLDYMHARYYSPHLGRFMSVDPSNQSWNLRNPQSWNRYSYALGNPIRFIDPNGLEPQSLRDRLGQFFTDLLNKIFPPPDVDPEDPNIRALEEIGANPNLHPQNQAATVQEGLNKATGNLAAGLIFTGLKVGEVTFFARTISGFSVGGSALLERGTLRVNISVLARTRQGGTLRGVLRGFEKEAGRLGAQKLVIRGTLPKSTLTSAKAKELAEKLGFIFKQADDGSILLIK